MTKKERVTERKKKRVDKRRGEERREVTHQVTPIPLTGYSRGYKMLSTKVKGGNMRGQYRRPWLKLWAVECLEGSIRFQLDAAERGTWYDMLVLARICGQEGKICDNDGRPYPHSFIANRLNISLKLFETTLEKCKLEGRVNENEDGITITNWKRYQSEYERQKPYRQKVETDDPDKYTGQKHGNMIQQ